MNTEKFHFKAEIKQLLDILVHSLYTSREIFIRELISNASDALDKLRFEMTRGTDVADKDLPLEIRITLDEKENILTISDTGIGMSKTELVENIGTIAKSGSAEFIKQLAENKQDTKGIIGKFGVGFYSVFMAAKEVVLTTKSYKTDQKAIMWKSDGLGDYEITELDNGIQRGTKIEIHLKEDAKEFVEKYRVENIIKKYSNFISYPIYVAEDKINTVAAIWREPKTNLKKEQYTEFYKFLTFDTEEPAEVLHNSVDAPIQFYSLLFIPKKDNEFWRFNREDYGLDLYVRRVLIQHKNKDILPEYLSFVKGVVDSEDIPLNISRETLQENVVFNKISRTITSQVLSYLSKKAKEDPTAYLELWKEHGKFLKLGYTDYTNHDKIAELLRFNSSYAKTKEEMISLEDYVMRKKDEQKEIYYAFGNSREAIELNPQLEVFKNKGIEVLYLYDPIDEFVLTSFRNFKEMEFQHIDSVDLKNLEKHPDLQENKKQVEPLNKDEEKDFENLIKKIKEILGDRVVDVKVSQRLVNNPSCLVQGENGMSASMQKLMKQFGNDKSVQKKVLEINKDHKLIRNLLSIYESDSNDKFIADTVEQLFESALLLEGSLEDPYLLINRLNKLLEDSSGWYLETKK